MIIDDNKIATNMNDIFQSEHQNTFSIYVTGGNIISILIPIPILILMIKVDQ